MTLPSLDQGKRLIAYLNYLGYPVDAINIVYLEGSDPDSWKAIADPIDKWNDVRILIRNTGEVLMSCSATTEPGLHYTQNPMNPRGAARIAFGYHKNCWMLGKHYSQDALVQASPIKVHRDLNKDGKRTGDKVTAEPGMGLNQHTTSNAPTNVGRWSAGCLVGRYPATHQRFMTICRGMGKTRFSTSVIDGSEFAKWQPETN